MDKDADLLNLPSIEDLINDDTNTVDNDVSDSIGDEDILTIDIPKDTVFDVNNDVNESVDNTDEMDDEVECIILSADVIIYRQRKKSLDEYFGDWVMVCDCDLDTETSLDRHFYDVNQGLHQLYNSDNFDLLHDFEVGTLIHIKLGDEVFMNQLTKLLDVNLDEEPDTPEKIEFCKFLKMLYVQTYNDIFGLPTGFIPLNVRISTCSSSWMNVFVLNNGINVPNDKSCGSLENALIEFFTRKGITIDPSCVTIDLKKQFENYIIATLYKNAQIAFEKVYPDKNVLFVTDTGTQMNLNLIDLN